MICDNIGKNDKGHLTFAGRDTVALAEKYGTPLYLMDEEKIREKVRVYKNAMRKYLPEGSEPEFASKAFSCRAIYRIMKEENMNVDAVCKARGSFFEDLHRFFGILPNGKGFLSRK